MHLLAAQASSELLFSEAFSSSFDHLSRLTRNALEVIASLPFPSALGMSHEGRPYLQDPVFVFQVLSADRRTCLGVVWMWLLRSQYTHMNSKMSPENYAEYKVINQKKKISTPTESDVVPILS